MRPFLFLSALLLAVLSAAPADAGLFVGGRYRVPVSDLPNHDDSCRSWVIMCAPSGGADADEQFLLRAVDSYGLGNTIRYKQITPAMKTAWAEWQDWHGNTPTLLTLSADGKRVMSVVNHSGLLPNGQPAERLPPVEANEQERMLKLAALLTLEDPLGKKGRLFDFKKPPFWLPYHRLEEWNSRCPQPNNTPAPNVNVEVAPRPTMDPALIAQMAELEAKRLAAIEADRKAKEDAEKARLEAEAQEKERLIREEEERLAAEEKAAKEKAAKSYLVAALALAGVFGVFIAFKTAEDSD